MPPNQLEGQNHRQRQISQNDAELSDDGVAGSHLMLVGDQGQEQEIVGDESSDDADFADIPRGVLRILDKMNRSIIASQRKSDRQIEELKLSIQQMMNNPVGQPANTENRNSGFRHQDGINASQARTNPRMIRSDVPTRDQSNVRINDEPSCFDEELDGDISPEQFRLAVKTLKMPVLKSVDQYRTFKYEFDEYLSDTNYPLPYMRKIYLQAMGEGCKEAKAFHFEMKRVGRNYSYRKLVQEADKHFGLQQSKQNNLLRKLTTAYQLRNESLDEWYARIFSLEQDLLDRHNSSEATLIKQAAATQLVEGLIDEDLKERVLMHQLQNNDHNRRREIPNLKDLVTLIKDMQDISLNKKNAQPGNRSNPVAAEIGVNFARVQNQSSNDSNTIGEQYLHDLLSRDDILKSILDRIDAKIDERFNQFRNRSDNNYNKNNYNNKKYGYNNNKNPHQNPRPQGQGQRDGNWQQSNPMVPYPNNYQQYPMQYMQPNAAYPSAPGNAGAYHMHQGTPNYAPPAPQAPTDASNNYQSKPASQPSAKQPSSSSLGAQQQPTAPAAAPVNQSGSSDQGASQATPAHTPQPSTTPNLGYGYYAQPPMYAYPGYYPYHNGAYPPMYTQPQGRQGNGKWRT